MNLDELVALKAQRPQPITVVHCGSTTRAREAFAEWQLKDTLAGKKVFTIGAHKNDADLGITPEQAIELDILHLSKIDDADEVLILNVGGYLGESTRRELEYAERLGKRIRWLERMELTQALLLMPCAEAAINGSRILVERFADEPYSNQCFTYDVFPAGHNRYNKTIYGDIKDVLADIYENDDYAVFEDGQIEQADWQPTSKSIDLSDCRCGYCEDFCMSYNILPAWYPWHKRTFYRCKWSLQSLLCSLRIRWYLMHDCIRLARDLRRLDAEYSNCPTDEAQL